MDKKKDPIIDQVDVDFVNVKQNAKPKTKPDLKSQEESKVGKKLSDLTTKRIIVLVFAMMFSVPLLNIYTYED